MLDGWLAGDGAPQTAAARALLDQLLQASMVHPVVDAQIPLPSLAFVVPVYNDAAGLAELLASLRADFATEEIVVVDDASDDADEIAQVAKQHDADLARHDTNRGPAAARNTGWRIVTSPGDVTIQPQVVVFVDADVVPTAGAVATVVAHLNDPAVVAAAPRVRAESGAGTFASYEAMNSPLDLGGAPALVRPGNPVSYVPSAALAVRTAALVDADGFDETMRFGEDVDLIWRLAAEGHVIRYEPAAVVHHRNRSSLARALRQRFQYGSSAASLAARHGDTATPLRMPATILAGWAAALSGRRLGLAAAALGAAVSVAKLTRELDGKVDQPSQRASALVARAHTGVAGALTNAAMRNYLPLMLCTRRTRRLAVAAAMISPLASWLRARPRHDPITHVGLKAGDDVAYAAGVWAGAWRERSPAALLPDVQSSWNQDD